MLLVEDSMSFLLATFQQWDPRRILSSLTMFWSHWLCICPAGMAGFSRISDASSSGLWFSSSFTMECWLQSSEPLIFLRFSEVGGFEKLSWPALTECAYLYLPWHLPWCPGENKRRSKEWRWFGEEGSYGWNWWLQQRQCDQEGACAKQGKGSVSMGRCQWASWAWVGSLTLTLPLDLSW